MIWIYDIVGLLRLFIQFICHNQFKYAEIGSDTAKKDQEMALLHRLFLAGISIWLRHHTRRC